MAEGKSPRNPKWHRDEIILALDLYFDKDRGSVDSRNPKVIALSALLNQLPIFSSKPDAVTFRNPNGVGLKLSNFLYIDPAHPGKGMKGHSTLDKKLFNEFVDDQERLHRIAQQIKTVITDKELAAQIALIETDELVDTVMEGQVLYKMHKVRERDKRIVAAKKKKVLKEKGTLACEACSFDFNRTYGHLGQGYIECHHITPLSHFDVNKQTKLDDLALVCSNCHRMLHRNPGIESMEQFRVFIHRCN